MLNNNPAVRIQRGEWLIEIFEEYKPHEPHICIYQGGKIVPESASWETVRKLFFQIRDEGFLDKYKGLKLWIGYPKKNEATQETQMHFVTVCLDNPEDDTEEHFA